MSNPIKPRNKLNIVITKKVTTAYIAKIEEEYLTSTGTYSYKFNKNRNTSTKSKRKKVAKRILRNNDLKGTTLKQITDTLKSKKTHKAGITINIPYYERNIKFTKLNKATMYDEVYVIVETKDLQNGEAVVELRQGEKDGLELQGVGIYVEQDNSGIREIKAKIGAYSEDKSIKNKDNFKDWAIAKVKLAPTNETEIKTYSQFLKDAKETHLYMLVKAHISGDSFTDTFYEEVKGKIANRWYDGSVDGEKWFVLKQGCGNYQFKCVSPYSTYSPLYYGHKHLKNYYNWNKFIKNNKVTSDEKEILIAMSENEGNFDTVHSYDMDTHEPRRLNVLTAGTMQKTVDGAGKGEFPIQIEKFKKDFPTKYKELFEECGWTVENKTLYYKDPFDKAAKKVTGEELAKIIRKPFSKYNQERKLNCKPLSPIVKAIKDPDFQDRQVTDFIFRLNNVALIKKPKGHTAYRLKDFLKSKLGKATALDHDINRPGHVEKVFGKALDKFYTKKDNEVTDANKKIEIENKIITDPKLKKKKKEKISRNPNDWGSKHKKYEKEILEIYGPLRGDKNIVNPVMTDAAKRYTKLKNKLG